MKVTRKDRILKALEVERSSTAQNMAQLLGIGFREAGRCLSQLVDDGLVRKEKKPGYYTTYSLMSTNANNIELKPLAVKDREQKKEQSPQQIDQPVPGSVFMTINGRIGIDRVLTLKRLRRQIISEYHPIIDMVIKDYEAVIHAFDEEDDE